MKSLGVRSEVLLEAGLLRTREDSTLVPRFRGRLLAASADASPSDCFFAIAACLPCLAKLRQGDHTAASHRRKIATDRRRP